MPSSAGEHSDTSGDDFVSRVLKENPSQVEPKYLIGDKFYTSKEKETLSKRLNTGLLEVLAKRLNLKTQRKKETSEVQDQVLFGRDSVYLKDLLREYKGKLYVPEQIFGTELSEEEEFDKKLQSLPKMSIEEFRKYMNCDKIKLLTSKDDTGFIYGHREFVVDLKEVPGDKSLHRTEW